MGKFFILIVFILLFSVGCSNNKINVENDKVIACYMETELNNELYLKQIDPLLEKNFRREGNVVYYEWSDEYFEKKGKGCSRKVIEKFLKDSGFKIIK